MFNFAYVSRKQKGTRTPNYGIPTPSNMT